MKSKQSALSSCCCMSTGHDVAAEEGWRFWEIYGGDAGGKTIGCCYQPAPAECDKNNHLPGFISRLSPEPSRVWHPAAALCRRVTNHLRLPPFLGEPHSSPHSELQPNTPIPDLDPAPEPPFPASPHLPHLPGLRQAGMTAMALHAMPLLCR